MLATDEDSLICDLAETYQVYNYRELPLDLLATLSFGLRDNSRIKMRLANTKVTTDTLLNAAQVDALNTLVWFKTKGAETGEGRPKSMVSTLLGETTSASDLMEFTSIEDFEAARQKAIEE